MDEWLTRVRADFPYLHGRTYLVSAGIGLPCPGAAAAAGQFYEDVAFRGIEAQPLWRRRVDRAKERVACLLDVPVSDVGFFRNTSEVMNLTANSVDWQPNDEVVVANDDYPGVVLPWGAAEAAGGTVVHVDPGSVDQREQRLLDALTPKTRVLAVSHVHPWTGTKLDIARLGRACREVGALLVVDGIQALGATPVDLSCADVYGAGLFKWMLSGFGTSIGVFRERARSMLTPAYRSYGNPPPSTSFEYSAPNIPGLYVLDTTMTYLDGLGWDRIHLQVNSLAGRVFSALHRLGITPITSSNAHAGIVSFFADDSNALVQELKRRNVDVSDRFAGRVIVAPHFYNTTDDIEHFAEALAAALR